jgi:hypothetical protein
MTKSRVAWMFTGLPTICMRISRSGIKSGAISGSSSLTGLECTPGTKKPFSLKRPTTLSPTSVRSRSLVPGPSASNGAPSFQRSPVTALPRSTTPVPSGIAARIRSQKAWNFASSLPKARRTTFRRFSSSVNPPCGSAGCSVAMTATHAAGGPCRAGRRTPRPKADQASASFAASASSASPARRSSAWRGRPPASVRASVPPAAAHMMCQLAASAT